MEFNPNWVAGFFDGEGSIGIYPRNKDRTKQIVYYVLVVSLAQSGDYGEWILTNLQKKFGGSVYKQEKENHKIMWKWNVAANKALTFLNFIEPFLIIKKNSAIYAQDFQKLNKKHVGNKEADEFYHFLKLEKQ